MDPGYGVIDAFLALPRSAALLFEGSVYRYDVQRPLDHCYSKPCNVDPDELPQLRV